MRCSPTTRTTANRSIRPNLTDVKIAFFPDSITHSYDFCIKSIVPIMTAPNPVVATGNYGPTWNNQQPQAVNGINGYTVQSAPFPQNGNPMTMQVKATSGGRWVHVHDGRRFPGPEQRPRILPRRRQRLGARSRRHPVLWTLQERQADQPAHVGEEQLVVHHGLQRRRGLRRLVWQLRNTNGPAGRTDDLDRQQGQDADRLRHRVGSAFNGRTPYCGTNGTGEKVVSYWVATGTNGSPVTDFDLLAYFKDAASHGYAGLSNSSYMLGVQTGFEVYSGNWTTSNYTINIQ